MKKMKKFAAFVIGSLAALSLAACSSQPSVQDSSLTNSISQSTNQTADESTSDENTTGISISTSAVESTVPETTPATESVVDESTITEAVSEAETTTTPPTAAETATIPETTTAAKATTAPETTTATETTTTTEAITSTETTTESAATSATIAETKTDTLAPETTPVPSEEGKILVAYFSWSGTSERIANNIISNTGADSYRIERETPYSDDYSTVAYGEAKDEADSNARPPLKNAIDSIDQYDTIVLCYPIWWHTCPMTVGTFLNKFDFSGKTVIPVSQSASMDAGQYEESVQFIKDNAQNANVLSGVFSKNQSEIDDYLAQNGVK